MLNYIFEISLVFYEIQLYFI